MPNILRSLLIGVACLAAAACATRAPEPTPAPPPPVTTPAPPPAAKIPPAKKEIRIGLLLPLTGTYGEVGQALLNAATVAVFDAGDHRLVLLPRDTGGTPAGAEQTAETLIAEGVDIIAGPLLAGEVKAVGAIARPHNIKVIGFSTDRSVAGDGVYLLSFTPEEEVRRVVSFAASRGHKDFAALIPETPYGAMVSAAFTAAVAAADGTVSDLVPYPADTNRLYEPAKQVTHYEERKRNLAEEKAFLRGLGQDELATELLARLDHRETYGVVPYDAILLPEGAALLRVLAPLLPYYDVDPKKVQFLGTGLWNDPSLLREPQLIGGWFAAPPDDRAQAFLERYRALFRQEPPRIASLAYDSIALIATLLQNDDAPPFTDAHLTDPNGFVGIDGIFRFPVTGVAERGLAVVSITRRGFSVVSPAPTSFISNEKRDEQVIENGSPSGGHGNAGAVVD